MDNWKSIANISKEGFPNVVEPTVVEPTVVEPTVVEPTADWINELQFADWINEKIREDITWYHDFHDSSGGCRY